MRRAASRARSGVFAAATWCRCRRSARSLSLSELIGAGVERDLGRRIEQRPVTVGEALAGERARLRALPAEPFVTAEESGARVNAKSMVTVRRNQYSVPVRLVGLRVRVQVGAREIVIVHDGKPVARHLRLHGSSQRAARLDHYLELLARKPGALRGSLALRGEREQGRWPDCYEELWARIGERVGASEAARQMVDVLLVCRELGADGAGLAVRGALTAGAHDGRAVALLARRTQRPAPGALSGLPERLASVERPAPSLGDYDQLLERAAPQ